MRDKTETPSPATSAPATLGSSGASSAAVQMKAALRGQSFDAQVGALTPRAPVQAKADVQMVKRGLKVRDCIRQLKDDGWFEVRQKGSHKQFNHATKGGTVTVAGEPGDEIPLGTQKSIEEQAGITLT